jgi:putative inorganic carbon (HCO3(-)) transporter
MPRTTGQPFETRVSHVAWFGGAGVASMWLVAWLVARYDAWLVLAALLGGVGVVALLLLPHLATVITVFLVYINFPAILTKRHGVAEVLAGACILLLAIPIADVVVRHARLRTDRTFALMLAFLVVLFVTALRAVDQSVAIQRVTIFAVEGLLIYWLVFNAVRTLRDLRRVVWTLLAAAGLLSALSLYQEVTSSYRQEFGGLAYRNFVPTPPDQDAETRSRRETWDRAQGPVDEPNRFAQILIVLVPLGMLAYRTSQSRRDRAVALVATLLILGAIGNTLSRGAFLGLVVTGIAMVSLRWIRRAHLIACLVCGILLLSLVSPIYVRRIVSIANVGHATSDDPTKRGQADGAIRGRLTSMLTALSVFRDHPVLGIGPGQFRFYYMDYYKNNPDFALRNNIQGPRRAHNLYLEMGAETGIVGLGVFLAIVCLLMRDLWRTRWQVKSAHPELADVAAAFWLSLLAYFTTAIFLHLSYQRYYWFMLAMAGVAAALGRSTAAVNPLTAPSPERVSLLTPLRNRQSVSQRT